MTFNITKVKTPPCSFPTPLIPQLEDTAEVTEEVHSTELTGKDLLGTNCSVSGFFWNPIPLYLTVSGSQQLSTEMPWSALGHQPGPADHHLANTAGWFKAETQPAPPFFLS